MDVTRDGRTWRIGTADDIAWITGRTVRGRAITSAIPPVFAAYATFHEPDGVDTLDHEQAVLTHLIDRSPGQQWWLGYLDTGAHDVVFGEAQRVQLYAAWDYVLVEAGAEQARTWRAGHMRAQFGTLPDLLFPADRSWLVSALWDDTWTCVGGSEALIGALESDTLVQARRVGTDEDATPPGHTSI